MTSMPMQLPSETLNDDSVDIDDISMANNAAGSEDEMTKAHTHANDDADS